MIRRYAVVQERDQIKDEIAKALMAGRNAELDLTDETGMLHVSFRITATTHDNDGSAIIGTTPDYRTINIHIVKNGEVYALLPN